MELPRIPDVAPMRHYDTPRTVSPLDRLVTRCNIRGIGCERTSRTVTLTLPDGERAEFNSIREAIEAFDNDPAYHGLPLRQYRAVR